MKYLVDANVLCEVTRPEPRPTVVEWLRKHERDIVVTPIVLGEIEYARQFHLDACAADQAPQ